jgi:hypothetical protein
VSQTRHYKSDFRVEFCLTIKSYKNMIVVRNSFFGRQLRLVGNSACYPRNVQSLPITCPSLRSEQGLYLRLAAGITGQNLPFPDDQRTATVQQNRTFVTTLIRGARPLRVPMSAANNLIFLLGIYILPKTPQYTAWIKNRKIKHPPRLLSYF